MEHDRDEHVSEAAASAFLERLRVLDAHDHLRWRHLREAALTAGFDPASVAQAEAEVRADARNARRPDWVRFALLGVPNRNGAQFWYSLLSAAGLLCGALAVFRSPVLAPGVGFLGALWFFGCAAIFAQAIRWMDCHRAWTPDEGGVVQPKG